MSEQNTIKKKRYDLDMSARFYPVYKTKKAQSLFCMTAEMDSPIDANILYTAVNEVIHRFPTIKVRLKKGYSWHYLEENLEEVKIFEYSGIYIQPINPKDTNGYWFRVSYKGNRIYLDIFHALVDGNGGLEFIEAIAFRYSQLSGKVFDRNTINVTWEGEIGEDETEDAFLKHYKSTSKSKTNYLEMIGGTPNRIKGTPVNGPHINIVKSVPAKDLVAKSKEHGASFTSYLTGVIAYAIEKINESKHPVVVMVPVNLRKFFPSNTKRNFVTFIRVIIHPNKCETLDDYIKEAHKQILEKTDKEKMATILATTVKGQRNPVLRYSPLFFKKLLLKIIKVFAKSRQSIIFTTLGNVNLPAETGIKKVLFQMNVSKNNPVNVAEISFNGEAIFSFTRTIKETTMPDKFFEILRGEGLTVTDNE